MISIRQPARFYIGLCLAMLMPFHSTSDAAGQPRSLGSTYKSDFLIGMAMDFTSNELTPTELELIKSNFNVVTPENSMKPDSVHPAEGRWTWGNADKLVQFCQENKIQIIGHTLVWHGQTGKWFFKGENGQPVSRDVAIERLKEHIHTEVGRYKGKIKGWDVVNEAINDKPNGDSENLRNNGWLEAIGLDYINLAFKFAHEVDPNAELYYNDYNIEKGDKHKSSMLLLKRLVKEGVPIAAVGIQGHWGLNNLPYDELDAAIADYKSLGLKVNISEMDVVITGQGGGQLTPAGGAASAHERDSRRGARTPPTAQQLKQQADAYATFFKIFQKHKDVIERVTLWGLSDARTWRPGQAPLLFDAQNSPKPAFAAVIAAKQP